jgi:hypothetical protein
MRATFLAIIAAFALFACGHPKAKPAGPPPPSGPVTEAAIVGYFQQAFPDAIAASTIQLDWGSAGVADEVIEELGLLGIDDMTEVGTLLPFDFKTKGIEALAADGDGTTNLAGMLRDLMVMKDARLYFETAWQNHYSMNGPSDFPVPAAYGVDLKVIADLGVFYGDDGYDERRRSDRSRGRRRGR